MIPKATLRTISEHADELEEFLWTLTGVTADWPIQIKCDDDAASELADRLQGLHNALKPYRKLKSK